MTKKIPFPIAIIIIVVCAVLVGLIIWQYGFIPEIPWVNILSSQKTAKEFTIGLNEEAEVIYKITEDPSVIHNTINYLISLRNIDTQNKSAAINLKTESSTCFFPEDKRLGGRPADTLYLGEEAYCFTSEECGVRFNLIALENTKATFKTFESCAPPGPEKPVLPQEIIIKKIEEITITTDKTEYGQGEIVKITVKNNLDKSIWYSGNLPSEFSWWGLEKLKNGTGEEVYIRKPLIENGKEECILIVYERFDIVSSITELKPNSEIVDEWDFKNCEAPSEIGTELELKFIDPGTYRFSFDYAPAKEIYLEGRYNEEKTIYSNEFTIK